MRNGTPSLRRRLLAFLALPLVLAWLASGVLIYAMSLHYSNESYDRSLLDSAHALERLIHSEAGRSEMSPQARILFEFDAADPNYYSVRSLRHGVLASNTNLPLADPVPRLDAGAVYSDVPFGDRSLRMVSLATSSDDPADTIIVSVAETLRERRELAREILVGTLPILLAVIVLMLVLTWFGVRRGLRLLRPLTVQLRARSPRDLAPLELAEVPLEIRPLTRTIDALLERVRHLLDVQERFIADAAHQLRTPLAGLRLQAERALADPQPDTVRDALSHIERLSTGASRAASQLLVLARAQAPAANVTAAGIVDLAALAREVVADIAASPLAHDIDLGYDGPVSGARVHGDGVLLREALANLIDNALRYGRAGGHVTVTVARDDDFVELGVEDDGGGVPDELLDRLGERFFRVPGSGGDGSGLGLAIVRHIAGRHEATVSFTRSTTGGLRVALTFPAVLNP